MLLELLIANSLENNFTGDLVTAGPGLIWMDGIVLNDSAEVMHVCVCLGVN